VPFISPSIVRIWSFGVFGAEARFIVEVGGYGFLRHRARRFGDREEHGVIAQRCRAGRAPMVRPDPRERIEINQIDSLILDVLAEDVEVVAEK
jgi:hypothetical protein